MRRCTIPMVACAALLLTGCAAETTPVPETQWVDEVLGDQCVIKPGMELTKSFYVFGQAFVRVDQTVNEGMGTACDEGVRFFMENKEFETFDERYADLATEVRKRRETVDRMTTSPVDKPRTATVGQHEWVSSELYTDEVREDDACSINVGDVLTEISAQDGSMLVQKTAGEGGGARCGVGEVFFVSESAFENMTKQYDQLMQAIADNEEQIDLLLENRPEEPELVAADFTDWVQVQPYGLEHDPCMIDKGQMLAILGEIDGYTRLYEVVEGDDMPGYTGCFTGDMFYHPVDEVMG